MSVGKALLDLVFPVEAYAEGNPLTGAQRGVVAAIAASDTVWTFDVNLREVLRCNGLPTDRDRLGALARDESSDPDPGQDGTITTTMSAFGGPENTLDSFRARRDGDVACQRG
ncbi:hypothetical protein [Micromonospora sp. NPDC092111]|uniref:hypothetical protein n=1 Tax=Micromonospora sp. NPDC092111 TaxID=3364289 RepID=UPI003820F023